MMAAAGNFLGTSYTQPLAENFSDSFHSSSADLIVQTWII